MTLLDQLTQDISILPDLIEEYESYIAEEVVENRLRIKGKVLEVANTEQAGWQLFYLSKKAELFSVSRWLEAKLSAVRGKYYKKYSEHYSRELSDRQKDKYIDNEQEVLNQLVLYLQVKELHEKYEAVCEAFKTRGFALRNITEIRIRSLEDSII